MCDACKIKIKHEFKPIAPDIMELTESYSGALGEMADHTYTLIVDAREQAVRKSLVDMGWTPPPGKEATK